MSARNRAAIIGVGQAPVHRFDDVPVGVLAAQAATAALEDAGLTADAIDGVCGIPHQPFEQDGEPVDGIDHFSSQYMLRTLRASSRWGANSDMLFGHALAEAVNAVEAGACRYALVFRAVKSPRSGYGHNRREEYPGPAQFIGPYGSYRPADFGAIWHRYRDIYGSGTRQQMARFVVQLRANGLLWPQGYWAAHKPVELTEDDYLNARQVCTPLCLFDCDIPVQSCGAVIVTTAERAADAARPAAYVLGVAAPFFSAPAGVVHRDFRLEVQQDCGERIAADLWADSGLSAADVKTADLYDGFSLIAVLWLEAFGFCGRGEVFDFIADGHTARGGSLPVNTSGGNIGGGRLHGTNHVIEAVLQVSGRAGVRQVDGADVALVAVGPASRAAALLLGSEPAGGRSGYSGKQRNLQ